MTLERTHPGEPVVGLRSRAAATYDNWIPAEDRVAWVVVLTFLGTLFANRYLGELSKVAWIYDAGEGTHFGRRMYWAAFRITIYTVPALLLGRYVLKTPMRELGWNINWNWTHIRPYAALFGLMVPAVLWASTVPSFQSKYPLFKPADGEIWPQFVVWELAYFAQFIALELFYRGFMLQALRPRFGTMAVAFMVVPYTMIHFTKPVAEAGGAIVAGTVLGIMAYRSGSPFWGGVLHFAVAIMIDLLVL